MKKDSARKNGPASGGKATSADHRVAQRHQKQSQAAQLSAANAEESPFMDQGDSAGGAGESLDAPGDGAKAGESLRRGDLDPQYGTKSSMKTSVRAGQGGRVSSAGSGSSGGSAPAGRGEGEQQAPNPGSSEQSAGAGRDTMTGARPGRRS